MGNSNDTVATILDVVAEAETNSRQQWQGPMEHDTVLTKVVERLGNPRDTTTLEGIYTAWYDQFRLGILSWGAVQSNGIGIPGFTCFHLTELGRKTLTYKSRDPINRGGYLAYLDSMGRINPIARSYIEEALSTYGAGCARATAVLVGAAVETIALDLRDTLSAALDRVVRKVKDIDSDKISRVLAVLQKQLEMQKGNMDQKLFESFQHKWPSFTYQIRVGRNDAGHPVSINPVTNEGVHGSLLILPEVVSIAVQLIDWMPRNFQ